ncbi:ArsR/SmtB family transcription factor [Longispora albida]|uniref:ArsR/SmtB family transcription factor n=1 Tax=Longispora albida TaxID=203523 RepID=UPI00037E65F7|nr:winged helix-turn-helix domain-containing protein [Longispora albida]
MLRVHFTAGDLSRVRVSTADPLWETLMSANLLQQKEAGIVFGPWWREPRTAIRRAVQDTPALRGLLRLMPPYGYCPDFLTPATGTSDLAEGIDTVLSTSRQKIGHDVGRLAAGTPLTGSAAFLAAGDAPTLRRLGETISEYHATVLAPHWSQITAAIGADRDRRAITLLSHGVEQLLRGLVPGAVWTPPVWHLPFPFDDDLYLDGRGITLTPSFFCWGRVTRLLDPEHPPVLAYPVAPEPGWMTPGEPPAGLAELIGRTRATALLALATEPASTSGLAGRLRISPASASGHARTLREAGLLVTVREGKAVRHQATDLGRALLNQH